MLAYQIVVNGEIVATGGVQQGVVSAIANWVSIAPEVAAEVGRDWRAGFSLSALDTLTSEERRFFRCEMRVGDEIRLKLIETDQVDEPSERLSRGAKEVASQRVAGAAGK